MVKIYTLSDPLTTEVVYVGSTIYSLEKRLNTHIHLGGNKKKKQWQDELKAKGLNPIIAEIESVTIEDSDYYENFWIHIFKSWGFKLFNIREPKHRKRPYWKKR